MRSAEPKACVQLSSYCLQQLCQRAFVVTERLFDVLRLIRSREVIECALGSNIPDVGLIRSPSRFVEYMHLTLATSPVAQVTLGHDVFVLEPGHGAERIRHGRHLDLLRSTGGHTSIGRKFVARRSKRSPFKYSTLRASIVFTFR